MRAQLAVGPGPCPGTVWSSPFPLHGQDSPGLGTTPCGPHSIKSAPKEGPLTCVDDTGTQCRRAHALCPAPVAAPCPAAPCGLWRQAQPAAAPARMEQRGTGARRPGAGPGAAEGSGRVGPEQDPPPGGGGVGAGSPLRWDPGLGAGPHSPTCRLAENWKMAVTGAVNRPEARLKPDPRRKAPWAVGWRDSR